MPRHKSTHVDSALAAGRRLKRARERAGLSQRQLAFPGCTPAYISRIESGERIASLQLLRELGKRLGVSADYLASGREGGEDELAGSLIDAELALRLDETGEAERLYRAALKGAESDAQRAEALAGLGQLAFRRGDSPQARELLEQALELEGERGAEWAALNDTLGRTFAALGESAAAIGVFERSLQLAEQREELVESLRFSVLLANALIDASRFDRAEELLGRALARGEELADPIVRARLYWTQSRLYTLQRQPDKAARYGRRALELVELTEDVRYLAHAHQLLAHVELDRGDGAEALRLVRRALELLGESGNPLERAKFRLDEARALILLGQVEEAAELALDSAGALREIHPLEAGRGYGILADAFLQLGERERARELYELAAEVQERLPNRYLATVYERLAELLEQEGETDQALQLLKRAVRIQAGVAEQSRPSA